MSNIFQDLVFYKPYMDMRECLCTRLGYNYKTISVYRKDNKYRTGMLLCYYQSSTGKIANVV